MKNWKFLVGLHDYVTVGTQTARGTVGGFSMSPIMRDVRKCVKCEKIHFIGYDIATTAHLDETLDWQPKKLN